MKILLHSCPKKLINVQNNLENLQLLLSGHNQKIRLIFLSFNEIVNIQITYSKLDQWHFDKALYIVSNETNLSHIVKLEIYEQKHQSELNGIQTLVQISIIQKEQLYLNLVYVEKPTKIKLMWILSMNSRVF